MTCSYCFTVLSLSILVTCVSANSLGVTSWCLYFILTSLRSCANFVCDQPQVPNDSFAQLLNRFSDEAKLEGTFFFCRQDGVMQIAKLLEKVDNLSLEDR